jgi:hypothetical protein
MLAFFRLQSSSTLASTTIRPSAKNMLAAIRLINQNPVKRELWVVAWNYKQEFKLTKFRCASPPSRSVPSVLGSLQKAAQLPVIHFGVHLTHNNTNKGQNGRKSMTRSFFAIAVTVVMFGTVPMTSQAAPIAPLVGAVLEHSNLTQTVACHMRRVCSRTTGRCTMRNVCNTPSRARPQMHNM